MFAKSIFVASAAVALSLGAQAKTKAFDGFYVGLQLGLGSEESTITHENVVITPCVGFACLVVPPPPPVVTRTLETAAIDHGSAAAYGAFAGINFRISNFVLGLEGDIDWRSGSGDAKGPLSGVTYTIEDDMSVSARARAGIVISESLLAFATAGYHMTSASGIAFIPVTGPFEFDADSSGLTYGGGIEVGLGGGFTGRLEYRRTEDEAVEGSPTTPLGTVLPQSIQTGGSDSVKLGISISF